VETVAVMPAHAPLAPHVDSARTVAAAPRSPRFDLYSNPHKALRLAMGEALALAHRVDPHDDGDLAGARSLLGEGDRRKLARALAA